ncbi:integral membrane protein [Neisseria animaloris]|uniref:PglL family O-oligosaccharyltransferase n=1 Tax=Neisseria animaloris TaxID=326522 RepID=UPI000A18E577|nr:PglL family O-oligosaccharyltransferase [Neisseria animaloris]OSI07730.1 polymerase [Neisseria animaloris]VEH88362.1 integral membrane protein [Neisseria animaloris]
MFSRYPDYSATVWTWRLWPLWLCFICICIVPFVSLYRVGPLSSFYLEAGSLAGAVLLLLLTALTGRLNVRLPAASVYFLVLAAFWWLQARLMALTYPGLSDMTASAFVILALAAWACRGWVAEWGQERVVSVLAWTLLAGALIQAAVALMQFTGWASAEMFRGIIAYRGLREVSGQLGQRNHLGHYLMWGTLAASYLWAVRRMPGWLGFLTVLALTSVLGLVNSRTILTYVIGVGLLLPFWRWRAGRKADRLVLIMLFALVMTVVVQFGIGPLLDMFSGVKYDTALERVEGSGFSGSARDVEWRKAWTVFLSAPFWGHGWGSFSLQGFLVHAQMGKFSGNMLNVLFTHSHNIVLQLLAEMGLAGTLLVGLGFLAAIGRMFARPFNHASLLLLAMMAVSLCHSMLEYPLWYLYFLVPFALMAGLSPACEEDFSDGLKAVKWQNSGGALLALFLLAAIARLGWIYTDLVQFDRQSKKDDAAAVAAKITGLNKIAATEPMLRYYAQLSLTRRANPADPGIYPWAEKAAAEALTFRPYANAYQVGLYQYRLGQKQEAEAWMRKMYLYYPYSMPHYAEKIRSNSLLVPLDDELQTYCRELRKQNSQAKPCDTAKKNTP